MTPLDTKLHQLMWSGREYTSKELYDLTNEMSKTKPMQPESFKRLLRRNQLYECYYCKERELWLWKVTKVLLPAPAEIRKEIKKWLQRQISRLTKT